MNSHRPVLKVAPRHAEPSKFRSILPGSTWRNSYKANLTLSSTNSITKQRPLKWVDLVQLIKPNFSRSSAWCGTVRCGAARCGVTYEMGLS